MSPRSRGKTVPASASEAKGRLEAAKAFVSVAELVYAEPDDPVLPLRGVAAAVAVLGGIAAADAICAARLGETSGAMTTRRVRLRTPGAQPIPAPQHLLPHRDLRRSTGTHSSRGVSAPPPGPCAWG